MQKPLALSIAACLGLAGCEVFQKSETWEQATRVRPGETVRDPDPSHAYAAKLHEAFTQTGVEHKIITYQYRYTTRLREEAIGTRTAVVYRDPATPGHPWWIKDDRLNQPYWLPNGELNQQVSFYIRRQAEVIEQKEFPGQPGMKRSVAAVKPPTMGLRSLFAENRKPAVKPAPVAQATPAPKPVAVQAPAPKPAPKPVAVQPPPAKPAPKPFLVQAPPVKPAPKPVAVQAPPAKPAPKPVVAQAPAATPVPKPVAIQAPPPKPAPKPVIAQQPPAKPEPKPVVMPPPVVKSESKPVAAQPPPVKPSAESQERDLFQQLFGSRRGVKSASVQPAAVQVPAQATPAPAAVAAGPAKEQPVVQFSEPQPNHKAKSFFSALFDRDHDDAPLLAPVASGGATTTTWSPPTTLGSGTQGADAPAPARDTQLEQVFRAKHGTPYDPTSPADRRKMEQMKHARSRD